MNINKDLFKNDFIQTDNKLSVSEVEYWKTFFNKNLKIGVELETEFSLEQNLQSIAERLREKLIPSRSNSKFGDFGVHSVVRDGSLEHGLEVPMIGKRFDFWSNYDNLKVVTNTMIENGAYLQQRAGLHNHLLLSYNGNDSELEKHVPGIIMRNFIQLNRRFVSELIWLTSTNYSHSNAITRMHGFRRTEALMKNTPANLARSTMDLVGEVNKIRYGFMRLDLMRFSGPEAIERFHLELRFPDASLLPSQIVAQQALFKAMLLKAIEFSQYGVVNAAGSDVLWEEQKELLNALIGNNGMNRLAYNVTSEQEETLKERAENMIMYFTNTIKQVDPLALEILEKLASKPVSVRRREKDCLKTIEKQLCVKDERDKDAFNNIAKIIDSMEIIGCPTKKAWEEALAETLDISYKMANHNVWKLGQVRKLEFDKKLGTVMFV